MRRGISSPRRVVIPARRDQPGHAGTTSAGSCLTGCRASFPRGISSPDRLSRIPIRDSCRSRVSAVGDDLCERCSAS